MSRTKRKYKHWIGWLDNFDKRLARGQYSGEITDPDDPWETVWGRYRKRQAKRRMSKLHRRADREALKEGVAE